MADKKLVLFSPSFATVSLVKSNEVLGVVREVFVCMLYGDSIFSRNFWHGMDLLMSHENLCSLF